MSLQTVSPDAAEHRLNRPEDMQAAEVEARLRDDIRLLGRILGDTVRDQEGADVFDLVERIRQTSIRFHRDEDRSARRELEEELGITGAPLRPLGVGRYEDDTVRCVAHAFEVTYDGPVTHTDGEVVWGGWMTLAELGARLVDPSWPFVPDTRALLERLAREGIGDYVEVLR